MADMPAVVRRTGPLFRLDSGWLFVLSGLLICAAGVLTPVHHDLQQLEGQLRDLDDQEQLVYARLRAYSDFLDQLDADDPNLVTRLAAAQLNWMSVNEQPVLLASTNTARITDWIDGSVQVSSQPADPGSMSILTRLSSGRYRLWLFAGGILSVFIGLLLGPDTFRHAADAPLKPAEDDLDDLPALRHVSGPVATAVVEDEQEQIDDQGWDEDDGAYDDIEDSAAEDEEAGEDEDVEDSAAEDQEDGEDEEEEDGEYEDEEEDGEYEDEEEEDGEYEDEEDGEYEDEEEDGDEDEEEEDGEYEDEEEEDGEYEDEEDDGDEDEEEEDGEYEDEEEEDGEYEDEDEDEDEDEETDS